MKTCLVVDDSRVIRKVACRILSDLAFATEEAENGAAALMACRRQMPDIILLDWNMPQMSGIEFLRALRNEAGGDHPVVVFCTTENDAANISEALGAGADEYIVKPFDRAILEAKLKEVGLV
jgi:two-component system, chemotaxis family, chemotaxis protein CheY